MSRQDSFRIANNTAPAPTAANMDQRPIFSTPANRSDQTPQNTSAKIAMSTNASLRIVHTSRSFALCDNVRFAAISINPILNVRFQGIAVIQSG
jgi:hypothetical protein